MLRIYMCMCVCLSVSIGLCVSPSLSLSLALSQCDALRYGAVGSGRDGELLSGWFDPVRCGYIMILCDWYTYIYTCLYYINVLSKIKALVTWGGPSDGGHPGKKNDGHSTPCPGVLWGLFGSRPRVFGTPPSPLTEAARAKASSNGTPCPGVPLGLFGSHPRVFGSPPSPLTEATRAKASSNGTPCPGVPRSLFGSYPRVFGSPP